MFVETTVLVAFFFCKFSIERLKPRCAALSAARGSPGAAWMWLLLAAWLPRAALNALAAPAVPQLLPPVDPSAGPAAFQLAPHAPGAAGRLRTTDSAGMEAKDTNE